MTIETLLGYNAQQLADMSDAEVEQFFAPYLQHIRPDPTKQQKRMLVEEDDEGKPRAMRGKTNDLETRFANLMNLAKQQGLVK